MRRRILLSAFAALFSMIAVAQTVTVAEADYRTYPFSDPNPVPKFSCSYPYYRFDGFTTKAENRKWTVVTLENDYLRLKILPQIGGKIWSVFDKKAGHEMFYDNDVIKFRDISMRGPWTSGGLEFNFGVIGHAPTCSTPVDYKTVTKPDGSVSCYIGVLDMITRTRWTIEINLPHDKGWFTTRTFWHNQTGSFQPYYNWVNTGVAANDSLHFAYPATYWIGHDGGTGSWPYDTVQGRDFSRWSQMNFGDAKSFHMAGSHKPFFSAYWADIDFGMMHYANRDEKLGRKFFTWALSDAGNIWRELLTDTRSQYVELQSGRLFNQNMQSSSETPYKQFLFTPYSTDDWTEYWFPYNGIGIAKDASLLGVVNVGQTGGAVTVRFSPLQNVNDNLRLLDVKGKEIACEKVDLSIDKAFVKTFSTSDSLKRITLDGREIWTAASKNLDRPHDIVKGYNSTSALGYYLIARDNYGMRQISDAEKDVDRSLAVDKCYLPSLILKAALCNYRFDYATAYKYAQTALSIDQYDAQANYEAGRAAEHLGKNYDALDCFEMAALTPELRSAAYTELAKIYLRDKDVDNAVNYARRSLVNNSNNVTGYELLYLALGDKPEASGLLDKIATLDPLCHFTDFERFYSGKGSRETFLDNIKEEFRWQEIMELVAFYYNAGFTDRAERAIELCDNNALVAAWKAYIHNDASMLRSVDNAGVDFVFPFRDESRDVLEWAIANGGGWKAKYLLALLQKSRTNNKEANALLGSIPDVKFAPLYALRAGIDTDKVQQKAHLIKACTIDPQQWRYCRDLTQYYLNNKEYKKALLAVKPMYERQKDNFQIGSLYVRTLVCNQDYDAADKVLSAITILPFEGEQSGRNLYSEVKLMRALKALGDGKYAQARDIIAEACKWPHNVGVGKPFDNEIDNRFVDWLMAVACDRAGDKAGAEESARKVSSSTFSGGVYDVIKALATAGQGDAAKADQIMKSFASSQDDSNGLKTWGVKYYNANKGKKYPLDYTELSRMVRATFGIEEVHIMY